ncbi:MAG: gluconate 2-dehydrogenase subunit 3 family protein [Candidatus Cyclobacteriaceae bacterium M2_1C_046]
MDRREAVKAVSLLMGGTLVGANIFLTGCKINRDVRVNKLFMESDVVLLDEIGETIIPTTDTPGAKATQIGGFMAMMVLDCYEPKDQKAFTDGLVTFRKEFEELYGSEFEEASVQDRTEYLNALNSKMITYNALNKDNPETPVHYYKMMKELTLLGYFTSEIGCTQAKRYIETPGRYDGCVDYKKGDKAWAT